jgi:hypothetical protein
MSAYGDQTGDPAETPAFDRQEAEQAAEAGVRALMWLNRHADQNWNQWSVAIRGWRGLTLLAIAQGGTSDRAAYAYRQTMNVLFQRPKWAEYARISKMNRSAMNALMDHIDDIDSWYGALAAEDKLNWNNPQTICKHAPKHLVNRTGGNKPPAGAGKKGKSKKGNPEAEKLRALLIRIITQWVMPQDAKEAGALLGQLYAMDPDDGLDALDALDLDLDADAGDRESD